MVDTGVAHTSLHIYIRNRRVAYVDSPASHSILYWLERLDGENVTKLVLMNSRGWLTIDPTDEYLSLCLCNSNLEISFSDVVSRQAAPDKVLQFIEGK